MTMARLAMRRAWALSWVTMRQVSFCSRMMRTMRASTLALALSSRAEVGSSRSSTSGELARVRARETRWASPPESWLTSRSR